MGNFVILSRIRFFQNKKVFLSTRPILYSENQAGAISANPAIAAKMRKKKILNVHLRKILVMAKFQSLKNCLFCGFQQLKTKFTLGLKSVN